MPRSDTSLSMLSILSGWRVMADPEGNEFDVDVLPPS
jgi:hypothetical protein